jgi:hypothetical protein
MFRTKFSIAKGWLGQHNTGKVRLKKGWITTQKTAAAAAAQHVSVARWFIFKPKIPIWVNFGGP